MPASYTVHITPEAQADLNGIFAYISEDTPRNAQRLINKLLEEIDGLNMLPYRYRPPRTGRKQSEFVRSMPVGNYLVKYQIDEAAGAVFVLTVRHGARRRQ